MFIFWLGWLLHVVQIHDEITAKMSTSAPSEVSHIFVFPTVTQLQLRQENNCRYPNNKNLDQLTVFQ